MANTKKKIRVWDLPTRLFHWSLVLLFIISWVSAEIGGTAMQYHFWSGYTVLTLVLFRILWGLFGSETARFAHFIRGPGVAWRYLRSFFSPVYAATLGHNALGAWSVIFMLLLLLTQAGTGLFSNDDIASEGPLYHLVNKDLSDTLSKIHQLSFNILLGLVGIHIVAILIYRLVHRENLLKPMVTGDKEVAPDTPAPRLVNPARALIFLAIAAVIVWVIVNKL